MEHITYTLTLPDAVQHLLDVSIDIQGITGSSVDLVLPAWTPGSYLMREYARHVQNFAATANDNALPWRKIDKARWRIETDGAEQVQVRYRVYGHELSVRTNHVDDTHAHVIPAATFMFVDGRQSEPLRIAVEPPTGWSVATGLDLASTDTPSPVPTPWAGPGAATFVATDYDQLVDSPFEIGNNRTLHFIVDGKLHRIVVWGHGNEDDTWLTADTQRIVAAQRDFWGGLPYEHYTFFLLLAGKGAGGGLEHRNSTSLLLPRFQFAPAKSYERFLTLVAHEFFHTWNVKRLRAEGLGPFDYTQETYTPLLWAMEGITEYYTDVLVLRAGLFTAERYLERLADDIVTLQTTPGRNVQSLSVASWDAWIKFYRPDENTPNTAISYYLKGALVAILLDLEIRRRTDNQHSLDTVMRWLYERYPISGPGVPPDGYAQAVREVTGVDATDFFARYIDGTDELPFAELFDAIGIGMEWSFKGKKHEGVPTLGIRTKGDNGQLRVANVLSDGPAARSGLAPDDELVAFAGFRITDDTTLNERLVEHKPGDSVELIVFRREELRTISVTLGEPIHDALRLVPRPGATEQQRALRDDWLHTS